METRRRFDGPVLVACPDARPPAYQAVVGLDRAGLLRGFVTASYYDPRRPSGRAWPVGLARDRLARLERLLAPPPRSRDPGGSRASPSRLRPGAPARVAPRPKATAPAPAHCARWRTERFDARLARIDRSSSPRAPCSPSATSARCRTLPALPPAGHPDDPEHGPRRRPRGAPGPGRGGRAVARLPADLPGRQYVSTATSWPGCTSAGSATSSWPIACSSRRSTSPRRWCGTGRRAIGPRDPLRRRLPAIPARRPDKHHAACLHVPLRRRDQPAQGDQVPARSLADGSAVPAGGSSSWVPCPATSARSALPGRGRAAGPGRSRRDARPDGGGRRLRVPLALRGLGRRDLRGAGLRPAHAWSRPTPARSSATASRASSSPRATSKRWRADGTARRGSSSSGRRMAGAPALGPWPSTGLATTPRWSPP